MVVNDNDVVLEKKYAKLLPPEMERIVVDFSSVKFEEGNNVITLSVEV